MLKEVLLDILILITQPIQAFLKQVSLARDRGTKASMVIQKPTVRYASPDFFSTKEFIYHCVPFHLKSTAGFRLSSWHFLSFDFPRQRFKTHILLNKL